MATEKKTRHSCNYTAPRLPIAMSSKPIVPEAWTDGKCRAIELAMGGGWLLMALVAVVA